MKKPTDIITRMEAMQQRFGALQLEDRKPSFPSLLQSAEDERRLQLTAPVVESEQEYNQRMNEREQDRYDMQEAK